jgi:hypothetical protein
VCVCVYANDNMPLRKLSGKIPLLFFGDIRIMFISGFLLLSRSSFSRQLSSMTFLSFTHSAVAHSCFFREKEKFHSALASFCQMMFL